MTNNDFTNDVIPEKEINKQYINSSKFGDSSQLYKTMDLATPRSELIPKIGDMYCERKIENYLMDVNIYKH